MWCNVGFAEIYVCSTEMSRFNRTGEVEKTIYTRKGNFFYNQIKMKFKIFLENDNEIHLVDDFMPDAIYSIIINKKTKEYASNYLSIEHNRDNDSYPLFYGKCIEG